MRVISVFILFLAFPGYSTLALAPNVDLSDSIVLGEVLPEVYGEPVLLTLAGQQSVGSLSKSDASDSPLVVRAPKGQSARNEILVASTEKIVVAPVSTFVKSESKTDSAKEMNVDQLEMEIIINQDTIVRMNRINDQMDVRSKSLDDTIREFRQENVELKAQLQQLMGGKVKTDVEAQEAALAELGMKQDKKGGFISRLFRRNRASDETSDEITVYASPVVEEVAEVLEVLEVLEVAEVAEEAVGKVKTDEEGDEAVAAELGMKQDKKGGFMSRLFRRNPSKNETSNEITVYASPVVEQVEEVPEVAKTSETPNDISPLASTRRVMPDQLDLNQAVALAITNNVQLSLSIMDVMAAREDVLATKSYMEPDLVIDASTEENRRKNTVEQSVSLLSDEFEEENSRYGVALEGILPPGTTYRLGYDMDELSNSLTNRTFRAPFDSQYVGFAGISVTQPLLRNFGLTITRSKLTNARLENAIAEQNLRKQRMLTVANTVLAYWEVWMQQELVNVRLNSLENARKLLNANKQREKEGKVAAIEVEAARVGVVKRETQWLDAHTQYHEAVNGLANLLSLDLDEGDVVLSSAEIILLDDEQLQIEDHLVDMWEHHPDVQIKDMEIEVGQLQLKVMENQRRPELNLVGSYGHNGLGEDWSASNDDLSEGEFDRWSIGMIFRIGLGGGKEMSHLTRKAKINLDRAELVRVYVQKEIENRLRTTLRKVALLRDTVKSQEEAVAINERALESEEKLLDAGKSKTARLLEVEEELLEVREDLVRMQTLYRRGLVEMRIANARILQTFDLE